MKITRSAFLLLFLVAVVPALTWAADPEPVAPTGAGQAGTGEQNGGSIPNLDVNQAELREQAGQQQALHPGLLESQRQVPNPLMDRINVVISVADMRLAELKVRLDGETNNTTALEIIRSMEQIKVQTELDILAVQAGYAHETGREEIVLEIEGAIAEMTTPRPVRQPVDRPAPHAGSH